MLVGYVSIVVLLLLALAGVTLEKAYFYLPTKELRRRAEKGDTIAVALANAAKYGDELRLLLVFVSWLSAATGVVLLVRLTPLAIGVAGTVVALLGIFFWQVRAPLTATGARFAAYCAGPLVWVLGQLHPVLREPAKIFSRYHLSRRHTGLYEVSDFIDLLERQGRQRDNRVSPTELGLLQHILEANQHTVGELMTPKGQVIAIKADDQISPVMINELHQSGQALFPVYEHVKSNIVGVLKLNDIADVKQHGSVEKAMHARLAYLNQQDSIQRAVRAFYETHEELFVVIDSKEKYVGILTIGDILRYLFGALEAQSFGHFDNPAAVAQKTVAKNTTEMLE